MPHFRAMVAEFIGTFALTFVGAGSIVLVAAMPDGGGGLVAVALAHGLILAVMVSATLHISGGQFNPAVSFALSVIGKQPWPRSLMFSAVQLGASLAAAALLIMLVGDLKSADSSEPAVKTAQLGATYSRMGLDAGKVLALEVIATFLLMFVILGTAVDPRGVGRTFSIGGFGIGLTVAANILFFGPLTGASMNPARTFGPACIINNWTMHWIYWVGPIVGAALAAVTYRAAFGPPVPAEPS
jgi:MIP family channel proteins